jgi:hypothetical protein
MSYNPENALIVQSDRTILLEIHSPKAEAAREAIAPFAELIKSPEHIHTYRLTPLSIWNARAAGLDVEAMSEALHQHAKYPVPASVSQEIAALGRRYGLTRLERAEDGFSLRLVVADEPLAEYSGEKKSTGPVTLATYQILTYRPHKEADFPHFSLFQARSWGLIIYDEVHLLPAPIFRITAELQARRRLGLTATLIREDGREGDVFALIEPKRYDVPWRELEAQGFIAAATYF